MVNEINPIIQSPPPLPIAEGQSYSKLAVLGIFLAVLPVLLIWTTLVILSLPLKCCNLIQKCKGKEQIHFVNALIKEYFSILSQMVHYPCSKKYHYTAGEGKPILLVHGYLHNASGWYSLIDRLKAENLGPVYSIDLGDGTLDGKFWSINKYANQVLRKTEEIAAETGRNDLTVIGHSMGGLVAATYAKLAPPNTVTDVYTIGTPLYGSPLAPVLGNGPNAREMVPGSKFLEEVRQGINETADRIHYRHIGSRADQLIPAHDDLDVVFDDEGHASLLNSELVADKLCEWLKSSTDPV